MSNDDLVAVIKRRNDPLIRMHKERSKECSGPPLRGREHFKDAFPCVTCGTHTHYAVSTAHLRIEAMCSQACYDIWDRKVVKARGSELSAAEQFNVYMSGWHTGAGLRVIPKDIAEHRNPLVREEWQSGYTDGRMAREIAAREASIRTGHTPDTVTID